MVASAAVDRVPLAGVGAHCVDAELPWVTRPRLGETFVDVNAVAKGILDIAGTTFNLGTTAE